MLREKINPIVDEFIGQLDKLKEEIIDRQKDLEKEISKVVEQQGFVKDERIENKRALKSKLDKYSDSIENTKKAEQNLILETSVYNKKVNEVDKKLKQVENTLLNAQGERDLCLKERRNQEQKTRVYEDKISQLKRDDDRIKQSYIDLQERERVLKSKEKINFKEHQRLITWEREVNERELDSKTEAKRIALAMKRAKLNE